MPPTLINRRYQWLIAVTWVALAIVAMVACLQQEGFAPDNRAILYTYGGLAAFFLSTALAYAFRWAVFRILMSLGGLVLALYAIVLLLLGTEDSGGPWVSIPVSGALLAFAIWNLVVGLHEERDLRSQL